jgi:hypothetical protein
MGHYRRVAIETYRNSGEPSSKNIRARPLAGQGFSRNMHVECSARMREAHPVGTIFIVQAQLTSKEGGTPFLYTSWQWPYDVVDQDEAERRISAHKL